MIKAVIFDKDGVIINTEKIHYGLFLNDLKPYSRTFSYDEYLREMSGHRIDEEFEYLFGDLLGPHERQKLMMEHYRLYLQALSKKMPYIPGVKRFLQLLTKSGILIALATSSRKESVDLMLKDLKKVVKFDIITLGAHVTRSKPNPEIFLLAADRLGVDPKYCLVLEDSRAGIEAAKAAGMKVGFVTTSHPEGTFSGVDVTISDFTHIVPDDILYL